MVVRKCRSYWKFENYVDMLLREACRKNGKNMRETEQENRKEVHRLTRVEGRSNFQVDVTFQPRVSFDPISELNYLHPSSIPLPLLFSQLIVVHPYQPFFPSLVPSLRPFFPSRSFSPESFFSLSLLSRARASELLTSVLEVTIEILFTKSVLDH